MNEDVISHDIAVDYGPSPTRHMLVNVIAIMQECYSSDELGCSIPDENLWDMMSWESPCNSLLGSVRRFRTNQSSLKDFGSRVGSLRHVWLGSGL